MIKMTIHHGEEVQQRDLPCDFLSLRMSLYQMNLMLAPNEVSVRDVQAEFTSTDPIGQKLIASSVPVTCCRMWMWQSISSRQLPRRSRKLCVSAS